MAFLLCHQCYSWVEPLGEQCPQCDFPLDARLADPAPAELAAAIGDVTGFIGEVRLRRTPLPDRGLLYETANGLFFVPHQQKQVTLDAAPANVHPVRALLFAAAGAAPAFFRKQSPRGQNAARVRVAVSKRSPLSPAEYDQLPLLLMQDPGVFFLSKHAIRKIHRSLWSWTITRANGLELRMKAIGDRSGFHERMAAVAASIAEAVRP